MVMMLRRVNLKLLSKSQGEDQKRLIVMRMETNLQRRRNQRSLRNQSPKKAQRSKRNLNPMKTKVRRFPKSVVQRRKNQLSKPRMLTIRINLNQLTK